jgi:hypothetical protein
MTRNLILTLVLFLPYSLFSQIILVEKWTLDTAAQESSTIDIIKEKYHLQPNEITSGTKREKILDSIFLALPKSGWTEYDVNNEMVSKSLSFPVYRLDTALTPSEVPPYEMVEIILQTELKTFDIVKVNFYKISNGDQFETIGLSLFMVNTDLSYGEVIKNKPILRIKTFVKDPSFLQEILSLKGK